MFHIFCGCPFLPLLFLSGIMLAMVTERRKLKRHSVPNLLCWRVMLFGLWMMFVPAFALLHGFILKPVYREYEQSALERSFNGVWGR